MIFLSYYDAIRKSYYSCHKSLLTAIKVLEHVHPSNVQLKCVTIRQLSSRPVISKMLKPDNFQTHHSRCGHKISNSGLKYRFSLFQTLATIFLFLPSVLSQFCMTVPQPAKLSYLHSLFAGGGVVSLCPDFVISSEGCDTDEQPFTVFDRDLQVSCDDFFGSGGLCEISCPGRHFEVESGRTLVLEGMTLKGATSGSVNLKTRGNLIVFDSTWEGYVFEENINS